MKTIIITVFWIYCCFFSFETIQENLYMILSFWNLLFESGNTISQFYQKQIRFLSLALLNFFVNFVKEIHQSISSVSSPSIIYIVRVSLESFCEIKLISIVNWIFHSLIVLWSFIILLKYGLIISRYSLGDKFLSLTPLLSYLI